MLALASMCEIPPQASLISRTSRRPRLCCTAIITSESPACTGAIENIATNKDSACSTTLGTCAQAVLQCQ
jgi:hypothetical protein